MSATVLLSIAVVVLVVRLVGALVARLGQPRVVGELAAGVVLGPGMLGQLVPAFHAALFPSEALDALEVLAQVGLIFFMMLVGMELNQAAVRTMARRVVAISQVTILLPMALAAVLAQLLYGVFPTPVGRPAFTVFLAVAMSVTALPVLARLLAESGLRGTWVGSVALACAAINDIVAWLLLAGAVALIGVAGPVEAVAKVLLAAGYVAAMLVVVRPLLRRVRRLPLWAAVVITVLSAWVAEHAGVHTVFGAFLAGVVMPGNGAWRMTVHRQLDAVVGNVLLPIFFVVVGLSTRVDQLGTAVHWLLALLVLVVAVAGKLGGAAVVARLVGESWPDALRIGVLMNARGVTEVVILSVGLRLGVITPPLFTIMVGMAIATTLMAVPALRLLDRVPGRSAQRLS
ncbi:cation:proton antiporter [Pseudonocardia acaciae]|uniref:cation:proton antiporter domain-containing protein n=1 Tax=Pseudonocardia acaciae TaxID=551276 RepID=UPI0009FBB1B7|nr:cation:proton antiporter [Pseudonocardia acaciae]